MVWMCDEVNHHVFQRLAAMMVHAEGELPHPLPAGPKQVLSIFKVLIQDSHSIKSLVFYITTLEDLFDEKSALLPILSVNIAQEIVTQSAIFSDRYRTDMFLHIIRFLMRGMDTWTNPVEPLDRVKEIVSEFSSLVDVLMQAESNGVGLHLAVDVYAKTLAWNLKLIVRGVESYGSKAELRNLKFVSRIVGLLKDRMERVRYGRSSEEASGEELGSIFRDALDATTNITSVIQFDGHIIDILE